MSRKPRFECPGGVYHLIQRGNNKEFIFEKKEDKEYLLSLIKDYSKTMEFKLYGYVIMGNHYHLIVRITQTPLCEIMHRINNKFSKRYNWKNDRTGHVFENRYKGILVLDEAYLLSLLRYVHQNPINANICKNIEDYYWGSDANYRRNNRHGIVDIDFILNILSKDRATAIKSYIDFMGDSNLEDISVFEDVATIGKLNATDPDAVAEAEEIIDDWLTVEKKSLDQILREVSKNTEIYEQLKSGSRKRYLTLYKKEFIEIALETNYTMSEIGGTLAVSGVAICKMRRRKE